MFNKRPDFGDGAEAPLEQHWDDRNLFGLCVRLEVTESRESGIAVPLRKGMKGFLLLHGIVRDAVDSVDILATRNRPRAPSPSRRDAS